MTASLPFLTTYDPPGDSEGTIDPLGLYQIADQLAGQLVPAVRERMQRVRFLTAMAVGSLVTEGLEEDPSHHDASPFLVWEWLVVEAMIRDSGNAPSMWGVPGSRVTRNALAQHGYLDARSYLMKPRIYGFHGVYKRLAVHIGVLDVHLGPGPQAERLADAWARDRGLGGIAGAKQLLDRWTSSVQRSLNQSPPRSKLSRNSSDWVEIAQAFCPDTAKAKEKRVLRQLLLEGDDQALGALPQIWQLQPEFEDEAFQEEALHLALERSAPAYGGLLEAIRAYERFGRGLQDAFDVLRAEAAGPDAQGFAISEIARSEAFQACVDRLHERFDVAHHALGEVPAAGLSLQSLFDERFGRLAEPMKPASRAFALCELHEAVQRGKSAQGKRPWFDRIGNDRIYIRHAYRIEPPEISPQRYVHSYRGFPIRRFWDDLT